MRHTYRAEQFISISGSECGTEIELKMVISFMVNPGCKASISGPEEEATPEVIAVRFFDGSDEIKLPWSIEDRFTSNTSGFHNWLLGEAADQHQRAVEDAADARREMLREDRT